MAKSSTNKSGLKTAYVSTVIGVVLVLFFVGLVAWFGLGLNHLKVSKIESYEIELYFEDNVNDLELGIIETEIANKEYTSSAIYKTSDEAWQTYLTEVDPEANITILDNENPIKQHIIMTLNKEYFYLDSVQKIEAELQSEYTGRLSEMSYRDDIFKDYSTNLQKIIYFVLMLAVLLLFIAIAMINNTIRLALFSKRFLIKTMQLVGATPKFIRRPFIWNAVGQGIISGLIAGSLVLALVVLLERANPLFGQMTDIRIFIIVMVAIICFGILITVMSTFLALRKYLRSNLDNLY
ncbi:MAG: cell division transport system permease protein [Arenicella sp.]|jgi:cell division transport system permease protein